MALASPRLLAANERLSPGWAALVLLAAVSAQCARARAAEPGELEVRVVPLERPLEPLDAAAPSSRFNVPDSEAVWRAAWRRASTALPEQGPGFVHLAELVGEGFRSVRAFHTEKFTEDDSGGQLQFVLAAREAVRDGDKVKLAQMRMVYFVSSALQSQRSAGAQAAKPGDGVTAGGATQAAGGAKAVEAQKGRRARTASRVGSLPAECQLVLTAPEATVDMVTNEGCATGQVKLEIYTRDLGAAAREGAVAGQRVAVLSTTRLLWRTWNEPQSGSTELALYTGGGSGAEQDPLVKVTYVMPQSDGTVATLEMEGRGLIYEVGAHDRPTLKEDEEGRAVGTSQTARNRAVFHRSIKLTTTAAAMASLMPFQGSKGPPQPTAAPKPPAEGPPGMPALLAPTRTVVFCAGPAVLDMSAVPRAEASRPRPQRKAGRDKNVPPTERDRNVPPTDTAGAGSADTGLLPILLARRFEFYNDVSVTQTPVGPASPSAPAQAGAPGRDTSVPATGRTDMSCQHLCMQYAAGAVPGPATFPEYAEALGGVRMSGARVIEPGPGEPGPARAAPYSVSCQRLFYDGISDNTYLVGGTGAPAQVNDEKGEASAQQFCFRRRTETLTMPASGPKRMVIKASALAGAGRNARPTEAAQGKTAPPQLEKANSPLNLGASDTVILWRGPLSRELRHLPVPHAPDRIKEVLTLQGDVVIEQPEGGLKMRGQTIRVVRNMPAGDVEFLDGQGAVDVSLGELQAKGESVSVELEYTPAGEMAKNLTTVTGNLEKGSKATLLKGGTAVRSDRVVIDRKAGTFRTFGGAVAVVKAPQQPAPPVPKPQAAQDAGAIIKGISFEAGGDLFLQCDGEFSQEEAGRQVTIKDNVLIRQTDSGGQGSRDLLADEVILNLAETTPAPSPAGTPADAFFSGQFRSLEGRGQVELRTPDQVVQCDRLVYDKDLEKSVLTVHDPENDVRVYMREESGGTRVLSARRSLELDGKSGTFTPGGVLVILPYDGKAPQPRDREHSPAQIRQPKERTRAPATAK